MYQLKRREAVQQPLAFFFGVLQFLPKTVQAIKDEERETYFERKAAFCGLLLFLLMVYIILL